jgi:hypothetical protein
MEVNARKATLAIGELYDIWQWPERGCRWLHVIGQAQLPRHQSSQTSPHSRRHIKAESYLTPWNWRKQHTELGRSGLYSFMCRSYQWLGAARIRGLTIVLTHLGGGYRHLQGIIGDY